MTCEFCGTQFKLDYNDQLSGIHVIHVDTDTTPLISTVRLPREVLCNLVAEARADLAKHATDRLALSLAEGLKNFMDLRIREDFDPFGNTLVIDGVVRVNRPRNPNISLWDLMNR